MALITLDELKKRDAEDAAYDYTHRWLYIKKVLEIIKKSQPQSILELGPYNLRIDTESDTMDNDETLHNITILHDATVVPWPIKDKSYDMFLGLQVLEHLNGQQERVFQEIKRISNEAIITLPYKWTEDTDDSHNGIDEKVIAKWTRNEKEEEIYYAQKWILYHYKFD